MPRITFIWGVLLVILGILGFVLTGSIHFTALIPTMIGLILVGLGILAHEPSLRKHTMHISVLVALVGFLGGLSRLNHLPELLRRTTFHLPPAQFASLLLALLCLVYIVIALNSFIKARLMRNVR